MSNLLIQLKNAEDNVAAANFLVEEISRSANLAKKDQANLIKEYEELVRLVEKSNKGWVENSLKITFTCPSINSEEDASARGRSLFRLPEYGEIFLTQVKRLGDDNSWEVEFFYLTPPPKPAQPPVKY